MYRQMYLKCCDKMSSKMKRNVFYEKVLGDLFPPAVAEVSRGILIAAVVS